MRAYSSRLRNCTKCGCRHIFALNGSAVSTQFPRSRDISAPPRLLARLPCPSSIWFSLLFRCCLPRPPAVTNERVRVFPWPAGGGGGGGGPPSTPTPARSSWLLRPRPGPPSLGTCRPRKSQAKVFPRRDSSPTVAIRVPFLEEFLRRQFAFRLGGKGWGSGGCPGGGTEGSSMGGGGLRWGLVFFLVDGLCCCDRIRGWSLLQSEFPKSGLAYARLFFR